MSMISVKGLQKSFGKHEVLKGIDIEIQPGEVVAIVGPSGCGKSTFLKTLDRMNDLVPGIKITGSVQYRGQEIYAPQCGRNLAAQADRHGVPEGPIPSL